MYGKFGRINYSETTFVENTFHKYQSINSSSEGVSLIHLRKDQKQPPNNDWSPLTTSGSHWASIYNYFYRSSSVYATLFEREEYRLETHNYLNTIPGEKGLFNSKFYSSASVLYIPQQYFGERIKPETFQLNFRTGSQTNTVKQLKITDDGQGNLYATNADISHNSGIASGSDENNPKANYIGNIFYDLGIVTLTDTSSVFQTSPSTASITCGGTDSSGPGINHFLISGSDGTSIKFISTGSYAAQVDSPVIKYFASASNTTDTAASASKKINSVFGGVYISASSVGNVVTMSNDATVLIGRQVSGVTSKSFDGTTHREDLLPISGSGGFTTKGFGGGTPVVNYTDLGGSTRNVNSNYKFYDIFFDSTTPVFTTEYSIKIPAEQLNTTMNNSCTPYVPSGSDLPSGSTHSDYSTLNNNLTASNWSPYFNQIQFYRSNQDTEEPILLANLPRAVKKRKDMDLIITFRLDH